MSTIENVLEAALHEAFVGVLDEAAPPPPAPLPELPTSAGVTSQVHFSGSFCGTVLVHCADAVARHLTQRMLGSTAPVSDADVRDAVAELTNIVTGLTLRHLCDASGDYILGVPQRGAPLAGLTPAQPAWCILRFPYASDALVLAAQVHPS